MKTLTIDWLRKNGACASGINIFKILFGNSCKLTKENINTYFCMFRSWDLAWLVSKFLEKLSTEEALDLRHHLEQEIDEACCSSVTTTIFSLPRGRTVNAILQIAELVKE